jgi:hypothetical protein
MDEVAATDQQRAKVQAALAQADADWHTWWLEHRRELDELREQAQAAADANDRQALDSIQSRIKALLETGPSRPDLWPVITSVFTPDQTEKFQVAQKTNSRVFTPSRVHSAVKIVEMQNPEPLVGANYCAACHFRHYTLK